MQNELHLTLTSSHSSEKENPLIVPCQLHQLAPENFVRGLKNGTWDILSVQLFLRNNCILPKLYWEVSVTFLLINYDKITYDMYCS